MTDPDDGEVGDIVRDRSLDKHVSGSDLVIPGLTGVSKRKLTCWSEAHDGNPSLILLE